MTERVAGVQSTNRALDPHGLRPVVDATVPSERARGAWRHREGITHLGGIAIRI